MIFGRTRDSLERFRDKETVTADNVLDLFYDLCEDVKEETGTPVDRLPVSSVDGLMRRLPWTAVQEVLSCLDGVLQTSSILTV